MDGKLVLAIIDAMERDKGIEREILFQAVEEAILTAARKKEGAEEDMRISIDRETGDIGVLDADGGSLPVNVAELGRIDVQTAKQVIMQKIREAERRKVFEDYRDRVGELITGTARRVEKGLVVLDLGRTEALLPEREQSPVEEYYPGLRLRAYIVEVKDVPRGPEIIVSRSHPGLVKKLFELEVPEISEGAVEVRAVAREAGYRTKIAVASNQARVDAVGACVGMRGSRVKSIVRELNGEKIDIVRWEDDIVAYATNALSPAKLREIKVDEKRKRLDIIVDKDQLSLAIGKKGQNARLTAKLTGWKIDIRKEGSIVDKLKEAKATLASIPGVGEKMADKLAEAGFLSIEGILAADVEDLQQVQGIGGATAEKILAAAKEFYDEMARKRARSKREEAEDTDVR
ncbi:MAG: transcription termination factor NusA [Candidatus Tritonobacter lacicola]|nr:transcription termination factor NusA [Candidatus Tritonobacter lacicola]